MHFEKYHFGSRELVVFVDESGDPALRDPGNPIFAIGACAAFGSDIQSSLREPWLRVRKVLTGSESRPVHMRDISRRARQDKLAEASMYFQNEQIRRFSVVITDKTLFSTEGDPTDPVVTIGISLLLKAIPQLAEGSPTFDGLTVIFEDGPLMRTVRRHWPSKQLVRNDDVRLPICWGVKGKDEAEPGLEVADFIAHTAAGFIRDGRSPSSKFSARYTAIHPGGAANYSLGWEVQHAHVERET